MILAVERGEDVRFFAIDLQQRPAVFEPPLLFDDGEARLIALMMHETLAQIGVSPGPLAEAPMPNQRLGDLSIDASWVAALRDGEAFEWSMLDLVDAGVLDFRIAKPPSDVCTAFEQTLITQHPFTRHHFLLPLEGGGALAGYENTVARLLPNGTIAETAVLPGLVSAARTSTAIFVLADDLYRASIDPLRFESIAEFPAGVTEPDWISAGGDQIFGFAGDGSFTYFDGRTWRLIDVLPIDGMGVSKGGALWLGPNEGAALNPSQGMVARFDAGTVHLDVVGGSFGFGAAVLSEKYGPTTVETRFAQLYRYAGEGVWGEVPIVGAPAQVQALTDYGGGLAWGTSTGFFGYATETDDCGTEPVLEASEVLELARLGEGLVVGYVDRNTDWVLIYFRPVEK